MSIPAERGRLLSGQAPQLTPQKSEANGASFPTIHIGSVDGRVRNMKWPSIQGRAAEYASLIKEAPLADEKKGGLNGLIDFAQRIWGQIDETQQIQLEAIVKQSVFHVAQTDRVHAAKSLITWEDTIPHTDKGNRFPSHMRDLLIIIRHKDFDSVGTLLQKSLRSGALPFEDIIDEHRDEIDPQLVDEEIVIKRMIDCFIGAGYVRIAKSGKISLTSEGMNASHIGHDELRNAQLSYEALDTKEGDVRKIKTMDDIKNIYQVSKELSAIDEVDMSLDKPSRKTLYLSEILLGNNTADVDFLDKTIAHIESMPQEEKPDVIVVSGLLQGGFKFRQKDRRSTLVVDEEGNVMDVNPQFQGARVILDKLLGLGVKIIYNISNEDLEICRDYTITTMQMMKKKGKSLADTDKQFVAYWQQDQLQQDKAWDIHRNFQTNVVFEYCLRSGRNLRSADKVEAFTNGRLRMEEYLMLRHIYQKVLAGKDVDDVWQEIPETWKEIVVKENIPLPGKTFTDFEVVNNVNLRTKIKSRDGSTKETTDKIWHDLNLGSGSMYHNPTFAAEALVRQWHSEGKNAPQTITIQHQQLGFGIGTAEGSWVISNLGFTNSDEAIEQKGSIASAGRSSAWRHITTRRVGASAGATMHEFTDDQRHIVSVFNEKLLEKADASADRTTVAFWMDWQNGSVTARPDLQVKLVDMVFSDVLPQRPTYLFLAGDMIHGRNYKGMPNENQHIGLIQIDHQKKFVKELIEHSLQNVNQNDLESLKHVGIISGNHEWNSEYVTTGAVHSEYLRDIFCRLLVNKNNESLDSDDRVVFYDTVATRYGDFLKSWVVKKDIEGYGVFVKHLPLERGGRGGGNKPPVYQAQGLYEGLGDLAKDIDISVFGHWHHPQYGIFGNKIAVVSGALAGLSSYELDRGHRSVIGATMIHLGGGMPPEIEFLSANTFHAYDIKNGYFTKENLEKEGFIDDRHFDPASHGFANRSEPKSGLQKALWHLRDEVVDTAQTRL
ncbi:MAG: hypothetical protein HYT11_01085 [Candidatus Levybacteria bacterium]|nr:hypothetical protein [Candidatus Levybacteria bacterium]